MIVGTFGIPMQITLRSNDGKLVDLSDNESIVFKFKPPTETAFDKTGETTDSTGVVSYVIEEGVLNAAGDWTVQVIVTWSDRRMVFEQISFTMDEALA